MRAIGRRNLHIGRAKSVKAGAHSRNALRKFQLRWGPEAVGIEGERERDGARSESDAPRSWPPEDGGQGADSSLSYLPAAATRIARSHLSCCAPLLKQIKQLSPSAASMAKTCSKPGGGAFELRRLSRMGFTEQSSKAMDSSGGRCCVYDTAVGYRASLPLSRTK